MRCNMGSRDRLVRALLVAPAAMVGAMLVGPTSGWGVALWALAGLMLVTAAVGYCVVYVPLGVDTRGGATRNGATRDAAPHSAGGRSTRIRLARSPTRRWWGLVFVALGGFTALHVLGIIDLGRTVGEWWPVAIIGWGLMVLLTARHITPAAVIVTAVGVGLLADEQRWTGRGLIWSAIFVGIGAAILFRRGRRRGKGAPRRLGPGSGDSTVSASTLVRGSPH